MITKKIHDVLIYSRRMQRLSGIISSMIDENCNDILDVGCGDGKIDSLILKEKKTLSIKGVDILVRDKTYIPVVSYDGKHIPYGDDSFHTVMLIDVLHHTEDPAQLMREITRVAKNHIIIKDHILSGVISYAKLRAMDYVGNAHYNVVLPYNYLKKMEWEVIFKENRLKVEKGSFHLKLYKGLFHLLFDSNLHFIVKLKVS